MSDELDDLKAAMDAATPEPDAETRSRHLALARKNFAALQGSRDAARPMSDRPASGLRTGVARMLLTLTSRGALAATTAIVAVGFITLTPAGRDLMTLPSDRPLGSLTEADSPAADRRMILRDLVEDKQALEPMGRVRSEAAPEVLAKQSPPLAQRQITAAPSPSPAPMPADDAYLPVPEADTEAFANVDDNPVKVTAEDPVSTFSIDVDTASYAVVRNSLMNGSLPPKDAVRIEEMVNYFPYDYTAPGDAEAFRPTVSVSDTPWNPGTRIVQIGIQGALPDPAERPRLNLVFLLDTSGSMQDPVKLPLLLRSIKLMLDRLRPEDEVAIVTYAGTAGTALEPTPASETETILSVLNHLSAGGSTAGVAGIEEAYALAERMTADGEVGRVLLATDGDFNVGISDPDALKDYIATKREGGTYLSVLGFGRGNLDDATMQALAQNGNGTASYIDTLNEAQKVLVDQLSGALFPIADDVKIQVEFNPAEVAEYRLLGYETRALRREDFNNDRVDAGDIGAGHQVTALYEITPVGSESRLTEPLRYGAEPAASGSDELGFLRLRYKAPGAEDSRLIEMPITADLPPQSDAGFAMAIAGFGQLLRGSALLGDWGWDEAIALANASKGDDPFGYRAEAVQLMRLAQNLSAR